MDDKWLLQQADDAGQLTRLAEKAQGTFWGHLGCEVVQADGKKSTICLDILPHHLNMLGIVHGGVISSLIDNAMGLVVMLAESNRRTVTASLNTHFLSNTTSGLILCEAELLHRTGRTLTLTAAVKDEEGQLLAWGSGAYRIV